jgi:NAD(P)-dependent dehydrogenase (short-subunit alcohol dehydrogenase family)
MTVRDSVVVVTGGASGIGRALARRFVREGARAVAVIDRDHAAGDVAHQIGARAYIADVGVEHQLARVIEEIHAEYGAIDLFCSNAGMARWNGRLPPYQRNTSGAPSNGNIVIRVPSAAFEDARIPAEGAAADWAKALNRNVSVAPGYSTCNPTDPLCIDIKNDHGTQPGDPAGCASLGTNTYDPTTGVWGGSTSVRFEPNWTGGDPLNLRETIAHELGHYFGLFDRGHSSCTQQNTIMGPSGCYFTTPPAGTTTLGPTTSDIAPLVNSTYGHNIRNTCGWQ